MAKPPQRFDPKVIGARITKARKDRGLTTEQLAEKTHIGLDSLYKKQRGTQPFYFDELSRVCDALGAPPLFPFVDWSEALLIQRLLRDIHPHP